MTELSDYKRIVIDPMVRSYNATIASLRERIESDAKRIAELEAAVAEAMKATNNSFEECLRLKRALAEERERCAQWHEHRADLAINSLHCGDNTSTIAAARRHANWHREAATAIRSGKPDGKE